MRKLLHHRQPDGLVEVVRVGRLRHIAVALAVAAVALPAVLVVLLALVAVVPVVALAIPALPLVGAYLLLMRLSDRDGFKVARVIPLHRGATAR